jgi:hypothetical protein
VTLASGSPIRVVGTIAPTEEAVDHLAGRCSPGGGAALLSSQGKGMVMKKQTRTRYYFPVVAVVALVVSGLGLTASAQQDTSDVLTGCLNEQSGVLRNVAVGTDPIGACNPQEAVVTWGQGDPALEGRVAALEAEVAALEAEVEELRGLSGDVAELQALLAGVERNGDTLTFSGMNVQVVNGLGNTYTENGLGNIVVGYNEDFGNDEIRTGSHFVVVGRDHTYTTYGGIVVGYDNSVVAPYSSVSGGIHGIASGSHSSVSGGDGNVAADIYASVSGGRANVASGTASSVSGGRGGTASGFVSSILGGYFQTVDISYGTYPN